MQTWDSELSSLTELRTDLVKNDEEVIRRNRLLLKRDGHFRRRGDEHPQRGPCPKSFAVSQTLGDKLLGFERGQSLCSMKVGLH